MKLTLYFDGLCEPRNPGGVATYGWLLYRDESQELARGHGEVCRGPKATNNVAEYCALGFGLRWILDNYVEQSRDAKLVIMGDAQLVVRQVAKQWACNAEHLIVLRDRCREILDQLGIPWEAIWIPREQNQAADDLSNLAYFEATGERVPERTKRKKPATV